MVPWDAVPERRDATGLFPPALLPPEEPLAALLDTRSLAGPPISINPFNPFNPQISHAQIPYTRDTDRVYDVQGLSVEPTQALDLPGHVLGAIGDHLSSNGDISGFVDAPVMMMDTNPCNTGSDPVCDTDMLGGLMDMGGVPAGNTTNISISSLRPRGARLPPQTYEENVFKLYSRLIREGADVGTAGVLHDVIFAGGVTVEALMAPVQTRELSLAYGGATKMWQLLLQANEVAPGKVKHFCLLCPVRKRPGYNYGRDVVRHFNKEHFGFAFPCEYW